MTTAAPHSLDLPRARPGPGRTGRSTRRAGIGRRASAAPRRRPDAHRQRGVPRRHRPTRLAARRDPAHPHPHARIRAVDTAAAATMPGVRAVLDGRRAAELVAPMPHFFDPSVVGCNTTEFRCLAVDKVLYVGEPVVAIVAESLAEAKRPYRRSRSTTRSCLPCSTSKRRCGTTLPCCSRNRATTSSAPSRSPRATHRPGSAPLPIGSRVSCASAGIKAHPWRRVATSRRGNAAGC